jgi:FkbM family methyltransferase
MTRINSWINSMWMVDDADPHSSVSVSLTVSSSDARRLSLGDCVSIDHDINDTVFPSPASQHAPAEILPVRPEVPAFQAATDHEIGVAYCKGFTYQYAYPKGATPADACRWSHIDETEVREELWDIKPGDIVYDIGSAFGSYALTALAMGAAHVVCFNPNPQEQDLLLASARLNGWGDKVTRYNVGLWSERGYLNDEEQTFTKSGGDFKVTKTADGRHTQLFEVKPLNALGITADPGRSVVKIDTEGAEAHVLKGARVFFAQNQPAFVLIEVHVFKDATLEQQTDAAMAELGYVPVAKRPYHSVMHALYRMKGWDD